MENYKTIHNPERIIIGIECRTSNAPEAGPIDIPKHWEKFFRDNIMNQIPDKCSDEIIALYCDYEGDYTEPYSIVIGCTVNSLSQIPEGMVYKTIPEGNYVLFRAVGEHPKTLIETWRTIWNTPLKRTYTGDYEYYGDKFMSGSPQEVEIFIAIE